MTHPPRTVRSAAPRFLASSALSLLGNSMAGVVLPLVLLARTGDALAAGTLALICAAPQVIAGILGGAALDRFNRRDVSAVSDLVSASAVALLPLVDAIWGLNFGWFVALGVLGAVGDVPGMTARDTLLPAIARHDGRDLQRFVGLAQSAESLVTVIGPALAAVALSLVGDANALWFTAALSLAAALATLTLPRQIGAVRSGGKTRCGAESKKERAQGLVGAAAATLSEGARVLFGRDPLLRSATLLALGIVMIMGSFQGMALPVHFTQSNHPEQLGYLLSAMSAGLLVGSLGYAALAPRLARRTWLILSFAGMAAGVVVIGLLPAFPLLAAGGALLGFAAGPATSLLGFIMLGRIPESSRGSALGTQNSLTLVAAPAAVFATSLLVEACGVAWASSALVAAWLALTAWALGAKSLRTMDAAPTDGKTRPDESRSGGIHFPSQRVEPISPSSNEQPS